MAPDPSKDVGGKSLPSYLSGKPPQKESRAGLCVGEGNLCASPVWGKVIKTLHASEVFVYRTFVPIGVGLLSEVEILLSADARPHQTGKNISRRYLSNFEKKEESNE